MPDATPIPDPLLTSEAPADPQPVPEPPPASVLSPGQRADLDLAVGNAEAFWIALVEARGDALYRRPGFITAGGETRLGQRILLLRPDLSPDDRAELTERAARRPDGPVTLEDSFGSVDVRDCGLRWRQLPVMVRHPAPAPAPTLKVVRAEDADQLATAERVMVEGFPIESAKPYRRTESLPTAVLDRTDIEVYSVDLDGVTVGACILVLKDGVAGLYWVLTLPDYRSRGVARELMHAMIERTEGMPLTLTAARPGKPLYDSLGFETITPANWWGRPLA